MKKIMESKKWIIGAMGLVMLLSTGVFAGYEWMYKEVTVSIDGQEQHVKTPSKDVGELLQELEIELAEQDVINRTLDNQLEENEKIMIKRAVPVMVHIKDKTIETMTASEDVEALLEELEIEYDGDDKIIPGLEATIDKDMTIEVVEVETKVTIERQEIPYTVVHEKNDSLEIGKTRKVQAGVNGMKEIKKQFIYENDQLVTENIVEEIIAKAPKPEIIEKGSKDIFISSRGNTKFKKSMVMKASAYDLSYQSTGKRPGDKNYGLTASGTKARPGVIAVDPRVIPLGTKVYIESLDGSKDYGFAVAEDTGGAIKGNRVDLFFESHQKALNFGRRNVKVYILD